MFNVSVNDKKNIYRSKPVMNVDTVPKPLTYDYMPEGYPSKSVETVTPMEEQEVAFFDYGGQMMANAPVVLNIKPGEKLTVVWDGVSYDVIVKDIEGFVGFGNLALIDPSLEATDSPFAYGNQLWFTTDTATTHTIKVMHQQATYTPMNANFMPVATEKTYGAVKTSDFIKMAVLKGEMDKETVYKYAQEFENGHIRLLIDDGHFTEDISSISKYGTTSEGEIFEVCTARAPYCRKRYGCNKGQYNFSSIGTSYPTSANAFLENIRLHSEDAPNGISNVVLSAKGTAYDVFLNIGGIGIIMKSSTKGSLKKFKITVDDSGTIKATEVT